MGQHEKVLSRRVLEDALGCCRKVTLEGAHPRGELAAANDLIEERQSQLLTDPRQMIDVLDVAYSHVTADGIGLVTRSILLMKLPTASLATGLVCHTGLSSMGDAPPPRAVRYHTPARVSMQASSRLLGCGPRELRLMQHPPCHEPQLRGPQAQTRCSAGIDPDRMGGSFGWLDAACICLLRTCTAACPSDANGQQAEESLLCLDHALQTTHLLLECSPEEMQL